MSVRSFPFSGTKLRATSPYRVHPTHTAGVTARGRGASKVAGAVTLGKGSADQLGNALQHLCCTTFTLMKNHGQGESQQSTGHYLSV